MGPARLAALHAARPGPSPHERLWRPYREEPAPQQRRATGLTEADILAFRCNLAALQFKLALLKIRLKAGFNPSQSRVPAGNPDGGQWTSEGGTSAGGGQQRIRLADAGGRNDPRVMSDATPHNYWKPGAQLAHDDRQKDILNAHIIESHVGKSDTQLIERIRREQYPGLFVTLGMDRNGSFESSESARDLINRTIENNPEAVSRVASGQSSEEFLTWRFGYETGREAYLDRPDGSIRIRKTYNVGVAIAHDARSSLGYRVLSAYPRNYNPRIGR